MFLEPAEAGAEDIDILPNGLAFLSVVSTFFFPNLRGGDARGFDEASRAVSYVLNSSLLKIHFEKKTKTTNQTGSWKTSSHLSE